MIVELCIMIVGTLRRLFASYLLHLPHTDLTDLAEFFSSDESDNFIKNQFVRSVESV